MKVDQVIVATVQSRATSTHYVLGKSPNIRRDVLGNILEWCPDKNDLEFGQNESVCFFQVDEDSSVIVRSFVGRLDHKKGEGRQIVSHAIVFHNSQIAGFGFNVATVYRLLETMGVQIFQPTVVEELPAIDIPNSPFWLPEGFQEPNADGLTEKLTRALDIHRRLVIVGHKAPLRFMESLISELPLEQRLNLTFATALNLNDERPFTIQFFQDVDSVIEREIASRQLRTISMDATPLLA